MSVFWHDWGLQFIKMAYRRMILQAIIITSLVMTITYAAAEDYPGNIKKPTILKWITAGAAVLKLAIHMGLHRLARDPDRWEQRSRTFVFAGGFSVPPSSWWNVA
jgi:hypothetical protein